MSGLQRVERTALVGIAVVCALVCVLAALVLVAGLLVTIQDGVLVAVWVSGIVGLGASVAACSIADDSIDAPAYLTSVLQGLRKEWQRS
jgi:hypothetical protein